MPTPSSLDKKDLDRAIGSRVRAAREDAGLSQRQLAEILGVSHQKVHALESGLTHAQVGELVEVAEALKVPFWQFLEGVVELPDLTASIKAYAGDLAWKAYGSVEHMVTAVMWLARYYRISQHLDFQPLFFSQSFRRPLEFIQAWSLPVPASPRRVLYVSRDEGKLRGVFFPSEIVPAPHMDLRDTPTETHVEWWSHEAELQQFLEANGYCWQLYPVRMHHDRFCGAEHRAEIEAQRKSAPLPGA